MTGAGGFFISTVGVCVSRGSIPDGGVGPLVGDGVCGKELGSIHQSVNDPSILEPISLTHPGTASALPF